MKCKCFRKITPQEEKGVLSKLFIIMMVIQTIFVSILCIVSTNFLNNANFSWFFQIDLMTLMIAIIFLSLIILIIAWGAAKSNASFAWFFFHAFMAILILIEILIFWLTSDVEGFLRLAHNSWSIATDDDRTGMQLDLKCCGYYNITEEAGPNCKVLYPCEKRLRSMMIRIRNAASITMFVDFVMCIFLDFVGCAICYHPEIVTLDQQMLEESLAMDSMAGQSEEETKFGFLPGLLG